MIGGKAEYRHHDYHFSRQRDRYSDPPEKTKMPISWVELGLQVVGWFIVLFLGAKLYLFLVG